jgi:hypothetical protein
LQHTEAIQKSKRVKNTNASCPHTIQQTVTLQHHPTVIDHLPIAKIAASSIITVTFTPNKFFTLFLHQAEKVLLNVN